MRFAPIVRVSTEKQRKKGNSSTLKRPRSSNWVVNISSNRRPITGPSDIIGLSPVGINPAQLSIGSLRMSLRTP